MSLYISLGFKLLWRDWKSGELTLLIASLILAVATVTSISLFTSRIQKAIYEEASQFIAADAKISGSLPIPENWIEQKSVTDSVHTAQLVNFRTMAFSQESMTLTQVKAVSNTYPLKGILRISRSLEEEATSVSSGPSIGEVWLAPRLFDALDIKPGDTIDIGEGSFTVSAVLIREPDSDQSVFGVAPRVMMHIDDIERTGALQVGSRARYSLLLSGEQSKLASYKSWVENKLGDHFRWRDARESNQGVGNAIENAERFLFLTACLSIVLTGAAIALSAARFSKRQQKKVAILKTLGSKPSLILSLYAWQLIVIGIISTFYGLLFGWLLHWGIIFVLGDLLPQDLASASPFAYLIGAFTAIIALLVFAAPPIVALRQIEPSSIFRNLNNYTLSSKVSMALASLAMILLMYVFTSDIQLTFFVTVSILVSIVCTGVLSKGLIAFSGCISVYLNYSWKLGLASLKRHQNFNIFQIAIFSLLFLVIFVLFSARTTLINQWQNQLPEDAPNHFIFNIYPEDKRAILEFFDQNSISKNQFYPMTRGRLISVNDTKISVLKQKSDNQTNYDRELNLTWTKVLNEDNKITKGQWWNISRHDEHVKVSVEQEYAKGLNMALGDELSFSIAGKTIIATVDSFRSVKWDSMNPNFFVIFNQDVLSASGANWISSFYLDSNDKNKLNTLLRAFPTVSLIEIDQTIEKIREITSKVSLAVEFIFVLVLIAGFLVLATSIQATLDIRKKQSAVFRALGASKKLIRFTLFIEFFVMGLMAGTLATIGSEVCLYLLQTRLFQLDYSPKASLWVFGPILSATLIVIIGWQSTKEVVTIPPAEVLKSI